MKTKLLLVFLLLTFVGFSQDFSNKGKEFWIAYPEHVDGTNSVMGLYMTSEADANVTMTVGGITLPNFVVTPNNITKKFLGPGNGGDAPNIAVHMTGIRDGIGAGKAIKIIADKPIVVFSHIIRSARSGATLALPKSVWGSEYVVPSYQNNGSSTGNIGYGEINVIASQPNTVIEITPSQSSRDGLRTAGTPYTVNIPNVGDVYQLQFQQHADISGTKIRSISAGGVPKCVPIAVYSATTWTGLGCIGASGGDNLYQQLFPVSTWGKEFVTSPLKKVATSPTDNNTDIFRVFVKNPATVVTKTENGITTTLTGLVASGNFYQFSSSLPTRISANEPIQTVQYITSENCGTPRTPSDPEMIVLSPTEQTISNINVFSAHQSHVPINQSQVTTHYLNVVMKTANIGTFKINGAVPTSSFIVIPGTDFSYLKENVTTRAQSNPVFNLSADSGFNAIAYGFGNVESYGYNAGTNVKDLYQKVTIKNTKGTVDFPATCINTPFKISMSFPYQPQSIKWEFGSALNALGLADVTQTNPIPTSTTVINGKTVYTYELPSNYQVSTKGSYNIAVIAQVPPAIGACSSNEQQIDYTLEVFDNPVAKFLSPPVCFNSPSLFSDDNSTTDGRTIQEVLWDFKDGTTSTNRSPTKTYTAPGSYPFEYTVVTDVGCVSNPASGTHVVKTLPQATVTGSPLSVCLNDPSLPQIKFEGSDGAPSYTFSYTLNGVAQTAVTSAAGNSTGTITVPTNAVGPYNYVLTKVKEGSANGCEQNYPITGVTTPSVIVNVLPTPSATIAGTTTVCLNSPTQPNITFTGSNGNAPYIFTYKINGGPVLTTPASTGNTVSIPHAPTSSGTFTYELLSVTDANGSLCTQSVTGNAVITVLDLPTATISGTTGVCKDATQPLITFTGNGNTGPYTFTYKIGASPTILSVSTIGTSNTVTVSVPTNNDNVTYDYQLLSVASAAPITCTQAQTGNAAVTIHPLPVANYSTTGPICATGEITFTDKSVANSASLTDWAWDFGDPASGAMNSSAAASPIHVYLGAGTYNVSLVVTNSNGCKSVNNIPAVVVKPKPTADFILPEVCLKDTYAQFTDASKVDAPASINAWNWNFGDINANTPPVTSNISNLKDPKHSYKKVIQAYDVTLEVITVEGCRDTIVQKLQINGDNPTPDFQVMTPATLCANDLVSIKNLSTVGVGAVTKIEIIWDAVNNPTVIETDEDPSLNKIYTHLYPNFQSPLTKTFDIILRAYSGQDCKQEIRRTVTLNAAPKVAFLPLTNICFDAPPLQITQASETGSVPGTFKFFGNGVSSSGLFDAAMAGSGVHTIKYVFTSTGGGCADSATQTIKVWERALANFDLSTAPLCEKQPATFTDKSSSTEGSITQRIWDFGYPSSGITRTVPNAFTHTLPGYGQYTVSLTVKTSDGCNSAPFTRTVEAMPLARPSFTFPPVSCLPNANIQFTNTSSVPNAAAATLNHLWDFGDPASGAVNSSPQKDPVHTYANLGPFDVKLQVTTEAGCIHDTTIVLNTIHPQPVASFTADLADVCLGGGVQFNNTSDTKDGTLKSLHWDLDDGTSNDQASFTHTYRNTGNYNVSLYIVNSYDCKSTTATRSVSVNPIPVADAGPYRVVLEGGNITINANATNATGMTYLWSPSAGLNDPTLLRPVASPANDTRYLLTVTSDKGCVDTSSMFLKVLFKPLIPNTFTPNGDGVNDRWDIMYLDSYPGAVVEVYNSTGVLIFRSVNYNVPWDGYHKGSRLPFGTYYYVVDPKNGRAKISGFVTIL